MEEQPCTSDATPIDRAEGGREGDLPCSNMEEEAGRFFSRCSFDARSIVRSTAAFGKCRGRTNNLRPLAIAGAADLGSLGRGKHGTGEEEDEDGDDDDDGENNNGEVVASPLSLSLNAFSAHIRDSQRCSKWLRKSTEKIDDF